MVDCKAVRVSRVGDDGRARKVKMFRVVEVVEGDGGVFKGVEVLCVLHS